MPGWERKGAEIERKMDDGREMGYEGCVQDIDQLVTDRAEELSSECA